MTGYVHQHELVLVEIISGLKKRLLESTNPLADNTFISAEKQDVDTAREITVSANGYFQSIGGLVRENGVSVNVYANTLIEVLGLAQLIEEALESLPYIHSTIKKVFNISSSVIQNPTDQKMVRITANILQKANRISTYTLER